MIVDPYVLRPVPPTVALMTRDGVVVTEHGDRVDLDAWPPGVRCWASYETVWRLVRAGEGEALCWNNEEIRWRHRRFEDGWKRRPSDVSVLKLPFPERPEDALAGLVGWRDWLDSFGAAALGTTGSAAWSLLRATLERRLWTSDGDVPPVRWTLGGRQELGPAGPGRFDGRLEDLDIPAAYASELGSLRYGGRWVTGSELGVDRDPEFWARGGRCVFVRAAVRVPSELAFGPLPQRPRRRPSGVSAQLGASYPRGVRLQGVWTWQELDAAVRHGCRLEKVLEVWVHIAGEMQPFLPWWRAVEAGRAMPSRMGAGLAKMTGNALWGRFCLDQRGGGARSIRSKNGRLESRSFPFVGGLPPAHDLAETVSGRVRARLYELMAEAGPRLLAAHTDGAWLQGGDAHESRTGVDVGGASGWRLKEQARRLDVLDPQVLRYWPRPSVGEATVVFSGMPAEVAGDAFDEAWARAGFAA